MSRYLPRIERAGGGGDPIVATDAFAPAILVGNTLEGDPNVSQAAPFEYIADPGDGSGIAAALVSAAARGCDVWLRPGTYTLDPATLALPLSVPDDVTIRGAGEDLVSIVGGDGTGNTTQEMFALGANSAIEKVSLSSPAPVAAPAIGTTAALVTAAPRARVRHVSLSMAVDPNFSRAQNVGIMSIAGDAEIDDCNFVGDDGYQQGGNPAATTAVLFSGGKAGDLNPTVSGWVRGCVFTGWNIGAHWSDCAKGIADDCEFVDIAAQNALRWETGAGFTVGAEVYGPRWTNCRISFDATENANAPLERIGCYVRINHAAVSPPSDRVFDVLIDNITCRFAAQVGQNNQDSIGVWLHVARGDVSLQRGAVRGILTEGQAVGVRVSALALGDVGPASVDDVRVSDVVARNSQNQNVVSGRGVWVEGAGAGVINRVSVMNSSCGESPAGGAGVEIDSACTDCHVGFNHLTTSAGGTALVNTGTTTEIGHNITT